ncbi:MAG: aminodeoxychorismate lyase [Flavobacteriales bacterium]|nr:aminodeoxychorismate lyase [Flavobacteriales bacterium]|tara:strand:+ start:9952 stop:10971 length:1020 start_codon:yes stop_codon:yes gene_type:complete
MKKIIKFLALAATISFGLLAYIYFGVFEKKIYLGENKTTYFYIKSTDKLSDVLNNLDSLQIASYKSFGWLSELRSYGENNIYPGRYTLNSSMTYSDLVVFLRSGQIDEVNVTFNNVRTLSQLAEKISKQIEATYNELNDEFNNPENYGYDQSTFLAVFIPNTYKMYWTTSAKEFVNRMLLEYNKFWNTKRKEKASKMELTKVEVSTLASIVQSEQMNHSDEWPVIAGLYFNRLQKGIKLQSDPTVVYAWGDFSIKRVYFKHLKIDSKYNTYKFKGLPPGPIRIPDLKVIDAVLNYKKHDYIFMCAKPEFSGKHSFATTNSEHQKNAKKYQNFLNQNKVR